MIIIKATERKTQKMAKAKRSLLQYVLRKDCRKVMRSVLCCSFVLESNRMEGTGD